MVTRTVKVRGQVFRTKFVVEYSDDMSLAEKTVNVRGQRFYTEYMTELIDDCQAAKVNETESVYI